MRRLLWGGKSSSTSNRKEEIPVEKSNSNERLIKTEEKGTCSWISIPRYTFFTENLQLWSRLISHGLCIVLRL